MKVFVVQRKKMFGYYPLITIGDGKEAPFYTLRDFFIHAGFFLEDEAMHVFCDPDEAYQSVISTPWYVEEVGNNYESVIVRRLANKPGPTQPAPRAA